MHIRLFDFSDAVPTAEGAIAIAVDRLPFTLYGSECIVTGFGRIAKVLVRLLTAFGAHVTVSVRKQSDLAWAKIYGADAVKISGLPKAAKNADVIFNTVPAVLFDKRTLQVLKKDCLVIDLASKPGGVDFDAAKELSLNTVWALSLPGKSAPVSAGAIIKDTIGNILSELDEEEI